MDLPEYTLIKKLLASMFIVLLLGTAFEVYFYLDKIPSILLPMRNNVGQMELPVVQTLCPEMPENLAPSVDPIRRLAELEKNSSYFLRPVLPGGTFTPKECRPRHRVAIIVSYRDRHEHLEKFLLYMHAFLQKQQLRYTIFIVEQTPGTTFNLGLLHNVGFTEADRMDKFTCFFMHDVDLLPVNETNLYRCSDVPTHFCHINSKYKRNTVFYPRYFGGVVAVTRDQYIRINGYSNLYFGWGEEDNDFIDRVDNAGYKDKWRRVPKEIGYYYAMPHGNDPGNPKNRQRQNLFKKGSLRWRYEGLNSLQYSQKAFELRDLYTWIQVDIDKNKVLQNYSSLFGKKPT